MMTRAAMVEQGIGVVTISRPPLNILTRALLAELRETLASLAREPGLRVLVLEAEGANFSAGADVREHLPPEVRSMIPEFLETVRMLAEFPLPLIAVVRGRCLGGGFELAQAADLIVAGESASFAQPEIRLGVTAPAACVLLAGRCPPGEAAELLYCGDTIDARRAAAIGLVHRVVADARAREEAMAIAARMARHSAAALRATKRALRTGAGEDRSGRLAAAGALYLGEVMRTHDADEGLRAFLEKRTPRWRDA